MRFYEFESKRLLAKRRIPVPDGGLATSAAEAERLASELGGPVAVKAQVLARGRTAAGQLKAADAEVAAGLEALVGERLRLEQGKSTPFRVLQKEQDLTDARARFGRAAADLRTAEAGLWRAVGALADRLGVDAEHWKSCDTCR